MIFFVMLAISAAMFLNAAYWMETKQCLAGENQSFQTSDISLPSFDLEEKRAKKFDISEVTL